MIKKLTVEIDDTEIELTPEQAKQLRDELLQIYPVDSAPVQPVFPLPSPHDWVEYPRDYMRPNCLLFP